MRYGLTRSHIFLTLKYGYPAYVKRTTLDKLETKFYKCQFVGYPKQTNGYQFYNYLEQKVLDSKHDVFMEKEFFLEDSGSKVELREVQDVQTDVDHLTGQEVIIHSGEKTVDPFEAQAFCRISRTRNVSER